MRVKITRAERRLMDRLLQAMVEAQEGARQLKQFHYYELLDDERQAVIPLLKKLRSIPND